MTCGAGQICSGGSCMLSCASGLTNCSGSCRDLSTDRLNCGGCGVTCGAGTICTGGSCVVSCASGLTNCAGVCRDLRVDSSNCGGCGVTCGAGLSCVSSACSLVCPPGTLLCGGSCINTAPNACSAPIALGSFATGSAVVSPSRALGAIGQDQWYTVTFPINANFAMHGTGTPRITFGSGSAASFRFEVRTPACGTASACPLSLTDWSYTDICVAGANNCTTRSSSWPTTVLVRVFRTGGSPCDTYTLSVTR